MTLDELNAAVATATGTTKAEAAKAVHAVLESIQGALKKGDKVSIAGFGVFETRTAPSARAATRRPARPSRSPQATP